MRVLAVEQYGAGPFGTQHLADLGAEVVKIENPQQGGDYARSLGPYFVGDGESDDGSLFFQALNRNKRSVAIDLAHPEGQAALHRLVAGADAVANNLRGDVPDRLGLTHAALEPANPAVVCAHLSAYGRTGPRSAWPGYDFLMQAEAGYFHMSGEPDSPPTRMGLSVVDFMAGLYMALGLVSAVHDARQTGVGRDVDVSLFHAAAFNLSYLGLWALNGDYEPERVPRSAHASLAPCQLFRTADGWIYVMCNKEVFWRRFCDAVGRPDLAEDPRYADYAARLGAREELTRVLDGVLSARSTGAWLEAFAGRVPAAPIRTPSEALLDPIDVRPGLTQELAFPDGRRFTTLRSPIGTGSEGEDRPCPPLGADTEDLLREAGFGPDSISKLKSMGVI